jgi:hypothetical protein
MGNHCQEICFTLISNFPPILWLGIIGSKFDDHHIGAKLGGLLESLQFPVRSVALFKQSSPIHPKIAHGVVFPKQITKHLGVTVRCTVMDSGSVGDAVANASNSSDGFGQGEKCADEEKNAKNSLFHS